MQPSGEVDASPLASPDHGDGWGQPAATMTSALAGRTINGHSAGDLTREDSSMTSLSTG
jgi:hypothetical protein